LYEDRIEKNPWKRKLSVNRESSHLIAEIRAAIGTNTTYDDYLVKRTLAFRTKWTFDPRNKRVMGKFTWIEVLEIPPEILPQNPFKTQ